MGGRRPKPGTETERVVRPIWQRALEQTITLSAVAALLSLTYLLFVLMSGGLAAPIIAGTALEGVERNVGLASKVFLLGLWVCLLAAAIRHYRAEATGLMLLLAGAVCWLILPILIRSRVPASSAQALISLAASMISSFHTSGGIMMVIGFLRAVVGRVILVSYAPRTGAISRHAGFASAMAQMSSDPIGGKPSLMRKCWELHFCRGSLRVHCPRYHEQRACWKARSGCYCDQGLATRLLDTVGSRAKVQVAEEMQTIQSRARQAQAKQPAPLKRAAARARRNRPPCGECPIYLDHQKFKYRVLSWLAYPAAAAVIGMFVTQLRDGYQYLDQYLGTVLAGSVADVPYAQPLREAQWLSAENAIIVLAGVLAAAVLLRMTEVVIFRLKL